MAKDLGGNVVEVQFGDTLSQIAEDYCGSWLKYKQLAAINNITNPDFLCVGQHLKLKKDSEGPSTPTTSNKSTSASKPTITQFGLQSNANGVLYAAWSWNRDDDTEKYKVLWTYDTGDGIWFVGDNQEKPVDKDAPDVSKQDTFNIPANAKQVKFKVKPIPKTDKDAKTGSESSGWTATWSSEKTHTVGEAAPSAPGVPEVKITKYQLLAELDNIAEDITHIRFQVVKNNSATPFNTSPNIPVTSRYASYTCNIDLGGEYKVRAQAIKGTLSSEWSNYSKNEGTIPATPSSAPTCTALSETSVHLEWKEVATATSYDVEYAPKKEYFDSSDQTTVKSDIKNTYYDIYGLESGNEYFFRVRAVNDDVSDGVSSWSAISSVVIGKKPAPPTTWSSTTTAVTGESVNLYWVHNTQDGSSQVSAELELTVNSIVISPTITIKNSTDEELKDKTSSCTIDTQNGYVRWTEDGVSKELYLGVSFIEGSKLEWRVKTKGIANGWSDWSTKRTIDIHAPATLELRMTDLSGNAIETLHSFPFYIYGLPGPSTQVPIGYHLSIISNEIYETVDSVGREKIVNDGEAVYSKYFDTYESLLVEFSASNIDLENNVKYTVSCTVSMNSGLTAEASIPFIVSWTDVEYQPNAEIGINEDTMTAYIRPYCEDGKLVYYRVEYVNDQYQLTDEVLEYVWGEPVKGAMIATGEQVYKGVTDDLDTDVEIFYCAIEETTELTDILLSVYRREFDGSYTELATDLDISKNTTVTDPHPALDYARYRIVAKDKTTGAISYYDPPGHPVGGNAVIIQWAEEWTNFETSEDAALEQPPWSGSMLKLPYNVDVSDSHKPDVALIEYIGRAHPVSYYGTQLGATSTWNVEIEKDDEETLYGLRRLARWTGDVYVREPSGSGYWANLTVSFGQKHCDLTIPVTFDITRVEGGA